MASSICRLATSESMVTGLSSKSLVSFPSLKRNPPTCAVAADLASRSHRRKSSWVRVSSAKASHTSLAARVATSLSPPAPSYPVHPRHCFQTTPIPTTSAATRSRSMSSNGLSPSRRASITAMRVAFGCTSTYVSSMLVAFEGRPRFLLPRAASFDITIERSTCACEAPIPTTNEKTVDWTAKTDGPRACGPCGDRRSLRSTRTVGRDGPPRIDPGGGSTVHDVGEAPGGVT